MDVLVAVGPGTVGHGLHRRRARLGVVIVGGKSQLLRVLGDVNLKPVNINTP